MKQAIKNYIRNYRHKKILNLTTIPETATVLDLSCADGTFLGRLQTITPQAQLFGIDISTVDIEKAKIDFPNIHFTTGSADTMPFEDNMFDIVFSTMSLHHYNNPQNFFAEVSRVFQQDGVLYLTDLIPRYTWTQKIHNKKGCPEPYHFEKFYTIKDLEEILQPCSA